MSLDGGTLKKKKKNWQISRVTIMTLKGNIAASLFKRKKIRNAIPNHLTKYCGLGRFQESQTV